MKFKYNLFLAILLVFICCIGAASAADDISSDVISTGDEVAIIEQTDDSALEVNNNENEILSGNDVSSWNELKTKSENTSDQTINLASGTITIGDEDINFANNAVIIGKADSYISGDASGRIPFKSINNQALQITFINSPQTHYTGSNTYNSINLPLLKVKHSDILGASFDDILSYKNIEIYINSSRTNPGDGFSWNNAQNSLDNFYYDEDIFEDWISLGKYLAFYEDCDDGDSITVNLANGEYEIKDVVGYTKYVGFGDNVVINDVSIDPNNALTYRSEKTNVTFVNLIFEGFSNFDGLDCSFINCTFRTSVDLYKKRVDGDFSKVISVEDVGKFDESGNKVYTTTTIIDAPIFKSYFDNCTFENIESISVIDANKYANLNINNCKFNNCVVDSLIITKSNLTKDDGSHDGVTISNINISGSTFKGVLKAQDDTIYSVEKVSGITPTADIIKDGKNIYLNATDVKAEEPINNGTSTNSTDDASSTNAGKTNTNTNKQTTTKKVTKKATKITAKKATFKAKKKTKKYSIVLKAGKSAVKKVKVTIKIGKKTFKATTNNKGKATFKITKLTKKGKYTATIKFAGNKNFKATSKKVKITVKK